MVVLWSITGSSVCGLLSWQDKYWDTSFIVSEGGLEKEIHIKSVVSCQKAQIAWAVFFFTFLEFVSISQGKIISLPLHTFIFYHIVSVITTWLLASFLCQGHTNLFSVTLVWIYVPTKLTCQPNIWFSQEQRINTQGIQCNWLPPNTNCGKL